MKNILIAMIWISSVFVSMATLAVEITIDPGNLTTRYRSSGGGGYLAGVQTFDFAESTTHWVEFGDQSVGFNFHLDASGAINTDTTRALVVGNTISVITSPVNIDPGLFDMAYNAGRYLSGNNTIYVVAAGTGTDDYGDRWKFALGDQSNGFYFYVDNNGVVTTSSSRFNITGTNTIAFTTIPVNLNVGLYDMQYNVVGRYRNGSQTIHLVPGGTSSDDFGKRYKSIFGDQSHGFYFDLDEHGVLTTDTTKATITSGPTITFITVPVYVDTQLYDLQYNVSGRYRFGPQGLNLVAEGTGNLDFGNRIKMHMGDRSNGAYVHIDTAGNLTMDSSRFSIFGGNTITFDNTIPIDFDPGTFTGNYNLTGINFSGPQTVHLAPAGTGADDFSHGGYKLHTSANGSSAIYQVESPCAILPSQTVVVGTGTNAIPFTLSCPNLIVDTDEDGVADTSDNCPAIANTDQLDQDDDSVGNVCDEDLDGDLVPNANDNCPNIENPTQANLDGDTEGDACDNDPDGDGVPMAIDNCPLTPNIAQQDNDNDGSGDACDLDDDNDFVVDESDNCPNRANADQNDWDADGQGDACDGDVDGDGIGNDTDLCSGTASGLSITLDGCSGTQHIDLNCVSGDFPNHGKYVSCVAHTAKDAVDQGLISNQEKSRFVSQAAKNK